MAKKQKIVVGVELKDPSMVIDLPRVGLYITKDNLTLERYYKLIALSSSFEQFFKLNKKNNEVES